MFSTLDHVGLLCAAGAIIAAVHTVLGPDHYVPFVAMAKAGGWSRRKMLAVTLWCGIGHVLSSVVLGLAGVLLGFSVFLFETIERLRESVAGWMLLGFGLAYFVWGIRQAIRNRPHTHWHVHADGTVHRHEHVHFGEHVHVHETTEDLDAHVAHADRPSPAAEKPGRAQAGPPSTVAPAHDRESQSDRPVFARAQRPGTARGLKPAASDTKAKHELTPWVLFTIFVFGPCEPLIPLVMLPASRGDVPGTVLVVSVFGVVTLLTMLAAVAAIDLLPGALAAKTDATPFKRIARYGHAAAGFVLLTCGVLVKVGW
ncbi:MAG: hypothetical protein D6781_07745 [Verrucomicrobia bacterium]|nr:MAG: hypothetical protein D6781_07745 [Verrucomicrobiota bacterium]